MDNLNNSGLTDDSQLLDQGIVNDAAQSRRSLTFIFFTVLVDVIGIGLIIPVIPTLLQKLSGADLSQAAWIGGLLMISFSGMQFLFAPVLGELSDRFGRRPVLLFALFGLGIDYFLHAYAPSLGWLFAGRLIAGIGGASFTVATSYIADVSSSENKAKNFGLIGAAFGIGFILGPVIGGFCARWGVQVPFFVAGILTLLNFAYGLAFIPESLPPARRRKINFMKMIPFVSLINLGKYKPVLGMIMAFSLVNLAGQVMPAIWSFFTMKMYNWNETWVGISLGVVGLLVGIVQAVLIGIIVKSLGSKKVIMLGFFCWTVGMILFCSAMYEWILLIALFPYVLGGIAGPTMQGMLSNSVSPSEQGNLQGTLTQLMSLNTIIGPLMYTALFYQFTTATATLYFPGVPFAAASIFVVIAFIIITFALRKFNEPVNNKSSSELIKEIH